MKYKLFALLASCSLTAFPALAADKDDAFMID